MYAVIVMNGHNPNHMMKFENKRDAKKRYKEYIKARHSVTLVKVMDYEKSSIYKEGFVF